VTDPDWDEMGKEWPKLRGFGGWRHGMTTRLTGELCYGTNMHGVPVLLEQVSWSPNKLEERAMEILVKEGDFGYPPLGMPSFRGKQRLGDQPEDYPNLEHKGTLAFLEEDMVNAYPGHRIVVETLSNGVCVLSVYKPGGECDFQKICGTKAKAFYFALKFAPGERQ